MDTDVWAVSGRSRLLPGFPDRVLWLHGYHHEIRTDFRKLEYRRAVEGIQLYTIRTISSWNHGSKGPHCQQARKCATLEWCEFTAGVPETSIWPFDRHKTGVGLSLRMENLRVNAIVNLLALSGRVRGLSSSAFSRRCSMNS